MRPIYLALLAGSLMLLGIETARAGAVYRVQRTAPLPLAGLELPPGKKFEGVTALRVNNKTRAVLLVVHLYDSAGDYDTLYQFADGRFMPVVVPG